MTSTDNTLELIERANEALIALGNGPLIIDLRNALERHRSLAIAAGYPEGVEAMVEVVKAMREALLSVKACEKTALAGRFVNLAHLRKAMPLVDAALTTGEPA